MNEQELDDFLIEKGFVLRNYDEFDILMNKCPFIVRKQCIDYGSKYYKYILTSLSLRSWVVYISQP